ncbi:hypothetical protein JCM8547_003973 [Rhodosporidiobolus lusitaniae]
MEPAQQQSTVEEGARTEIGEPEAQDTKFEEVVQRMPTKFREMLDEEEPIPSLEQLESFGLFDLQHSNRLLAEYRSAHPSPVSPSHFGSIPSSPTVEPPSPRPAPEHRHSLAAIPPVTQFLGSSTPSPTSPSASPRLNPFAFVRKATIRPRPSRNAKSTGDVGAVPPAPTPSLGSSEPFFSEVAEPEASTSSPRTSFTLSRNETVKENRAPRKLRKSMPPKITVRTDDNYLCRPFNDEVAPSEPATAPLPSSSSSARPTPIRLPTWRSSTSFIAASPLSYDFPIDEPPRSPSPVSSFPSSVRREAALPPVEMKKRGSTTSSTDDYLADNERARMSPRATRNRFSAAALPSPSSPTASNVWNKLRLGKKGSSSRPSSIHSADSSSTWEVVDGAAVAQEQQQAGRSFEVLGRTARPTPERSLSENVVEASTVSPSLAEQVALAASSSSPTLSRILEQPEMADKRSSVASAASSARARTSGTVTPAVVSASSSMTFQLESAPLPSPGLTRSPFSSNLHLSSIPSSSSLRSPHPPTLLSPIHASPSQTAATSSLSLTSDSFRSSRSSRSRDSLFFSGDEGGELNPDEDENTGASSAPDEEEEDEEEDTEDMQERVARRGKVVLVGLERLALEELPPPVPLV